MRELSLFTGVGGGLLGTKLLGWTHIGYVEIDGYCQQVIAQRIADGYLDRAPIFSDIREFIQSGAAEQYRGIADVVTAGFPCQPFSVAGKRKGERDDRNLWPETIATIRAVRPRYALLENVPGLLASGYASTIFRDLAKSGYECRWRVLSAAELGAPHKRDRLWIVSKSNAKRCVRWQDNEREASTERVWASETVATNTINSRHGEQIQSQPKRRGGIAPNVGGDGEVQYVADSPSQGRRPTRGTGKALSRSTPEQRSTGCGSGNGEWWQSEPDLGRVANGVPRRVDRLKALGNGQVPAVVRAAWDLLS